MRGKTTVSEEEIEAAPKFDQAYLVVDKNEWIFSAEIYKLNPYRVFAYQTHTTRVGAVRDAWEEYVRNSTPKGNWYMALPTTMRW